MNETSSSEGLTVREFSLNFQCSKNDLRKLHGKVFEVSNLPQNSDSGQNTSSLNLRNNSIAEEEFYSLIRTSLDKYLYCSQLYCQNEDSLEDRYFDRQNNNSMRDSDQSVLSEESFENPVAVRSPNMVIIYFLHWYLHGSQERDLIDKFKTQILETSAINTQDSPKNRQNENQTHPKQLSPAYNSEKKQFQTYLSNLQHFSQYLQFKRFLQPFNGGGITVSYKKDIFLEINPSNCNTDFDQKVSSSGYEGQSESQLSVLVDDKRQETPKSQTLQQQGFGKYFNRKVRDQILQKGLEYLRSKKTPNPGLLAYLIDVQLNSSEQECEICINNLFLELRQDQSESSEQIQFQDVDFIQPLRQPNYWFNFPAHRQQQVSRVVLREKEQQLTDFLKELQIQLKTQSSEASEERVRAAIKQIKRELRKGPSSPLKYPNSKILYWLYVLRSLLPEEDNSHTDPCIGDKEQAKPDERIETVQNSSANSIEQPSLDLLSILDDLEHIPIDDSLSLESRAQLKFPAFQVSDGHQKPSVFFPGLESSNDQINQASSLPSHQVFPKISPIKNIVEDIIDLFETLISRLLELSIKNQSYFGSNKIQTIFTDLIPSQNSYKASKQTNPRKQPFLEITIAEKFIQSNEQQTKNIDPHLGVHVFIHNHCGGIQKNKGPIAINTNEAQRIVAQLYEQNPDHESYLKIRSYQLNKQQKLWNSLWLKWLSKREQNKDVLCVFHTPSNMSRSSNKNNSLVFLLYNATARKYVQDSLDQWASTNLDFKRYRQSKPVRGKKLQRIRRRFPNFEEYCKQSSLRSLFFFRLSYGLLKSPSISRIINEISNMTLFEKFVYVQQKSKLLSGEEQLEKCIFDDSIPILLGNKANIKELKKIYGQKSKQEVKMDDSISQSVIEDQSRLNFSNESVAIKKDLKDAFKKNKMAPEKVYLDDELDFKAKQRVVSKPSIYRVEHVPQLSITKGNYESFIKEFYTLKRVEFNSLSFCLQGFRMNNYISISESNLIFVFRDFHELVKLQSLIPDFEFPLTYIGDIRKKFEGSHKKLHRINIHRPNPPANPQTKNGLSTTPKPKQVAHNPDLSNSMWHQREQTQTDEVEEQQNSKPRQSDNQMMKYTSKEFQFFRVCDGDSDVRDLVKHINSLPTMAKTLILPFGLLWHLFQHRFLIRTHTNICCDFGSQAGDLFGEQQENSSLSLDNISFNSRILPEIQSTKKEGGRTERFPPVRQLADYLIQNPQLFSVYEAPLTFYSQLGKQNSLQKQDSSQNVLLSPLTCYNITKLYEENRSHLRTNQKIQYFCESQRESPDQQTFYNRSCLQKANFEFFLPSFDWKVELVIFPFHNRMYKIHRYSEPLLKTDSSKVKLSYRLSETSEKSEKFTASESTALNKYKAEMLKHNISFFYLTYPFGNKMAVDLNEKDLLERLSAKKPQRAIKIKGMSQKMSRDSFKPYEYLKCLYYYNSLSKTRYKLSYYQDVSKYWYFESQKNQVEKFEQKIKPYECMYSIRFLSESIRQELLRIQPDGFGQKIKKFEDKSWGNGQKKTEGSNSEINKVKKVSTVSRNDPSVSHQTIRISIWTQASIWKKILQKVEKICYRMSDSSRTSNFDDI